MCISELWVNRRWFMCKSKLWVKIIWFMCKSEIWVNTRWFISKSELWVRGDKHADKHANTHINTMTRPGLGAGPSENYDSLVHFNNGGFHLYYHVLSISWWPGSGAHCIVYSMCCITLDNSKLTWSLPFTQGMRRLVVLTETLQEKQVHWTHTCIATRGNPVLLLHMLLYCNYNDDKDRHSKWVRSLTVLLMCKPGSLQLGTVSYKGAVKLFCKWTGRLSPSWYNPAIVRFLPAIQHGYPQGVPGVFHHPWAILHLICKGLFI